ncbi:MAG: hypothetical protein RLT05_17495 [Bauldia litoralis]
MRHATETYVSCRAFTRSHGGGANDRLTVTDFCFDVGMRKAHAVLTSTEGQQVELPVSRQKELWWTALY